jgi:hypothetical protein
MIMQTPLDFYNGIAQKTGLESGLCLFLRHLVYIRNRGQVFGLADVKALIDLIIGGALETADIEALAAKHGADLRLQASRQGANVDNISQALYKQLLSSGVKVAIFNVENIYEENEEGDENAKTWLNAEQIDNHTKSQIKEVRVCAPRRH